VASKGGNFLAAGTSRAKKATVRNGNSKPTQRRVLSAMRAGIKKVSH